MTWRNGRQLASYSLGGKTYRYEYDVNGLRTRKSNADGGYTEYYIIDGLAVAERRYYSGGGVQYTLRYLYDESNNPVGFGMQYPNSAGWTNYYFEKECPGRCDRGLPEGRRREQRNPHSGGPVQL